MKNKKIKAIAKSAKKATKNDIKKHLLKDLREITVKFGQKSKKLDQQIKKSAKQITKLLAKNIKPDTSVLSKTLEEQKEPESSESTVAN